jgi:hypothetical protein
MGMHQPQQQWGASPGYYNNPPPNGYYNSGMPPPSPAHMGYPGAAAAATPQDPTQRSNSISNTGLIRLTLRKPMGIVFEPMTDPHNPSQQRGVRICDLPRTGAAALSQKLEVGDELLSINDKTMSRLTFDEIMEFIIEADAERVDLLFRRPAKENKKGEPLSPGALGGVGSYSNSVKWIDESSDVRHERKNEMRDDRRDAGRRRTDDPSVGDDTYTLESQSQYTMDTYDDKYYREEQMRRNQPAEDFDRKGKRRSQKETATKKGKRKQDPIESTSFLDMLIDTLCTSVIGRDASGMCSAGGKSKKDQPAKNSYKSKKEEVYNEDDEFTVDDGTYATYEEGGRNNADDVSAVDDGTMYTEDDGTLTKNDEESYAPVTKPSRSLEQKHSHISDRKETKSAISKNKSASKDDADNGVEEDRYNIQKVSSKAGSRSSQPTRPEYNDIIPDPPTKNQKITQQVIDDAMEESAIASAALPVKELEYDDRVDYAADVSVMESLGGPSLLVERARHEYAVSSGAGHAAAHGDNIEIHDPELAKLIEIHGDGFVPDHGLTKEETALRDPYKFYEHAVRALLQENEPEKVRLLSKLMAKYRGRERHLINKLSARYTKEGGQGSSDRGDRPRTASGEHLAKPTMSGMEKIHEEGEGDDVTSPLNDPTRANLAAIESAKKRMETEASKGNANKRNDDGFVSGWPPAMSDPWGSGAKDSDRNDVPSEAGHEDTSSRDRHTEEGSYSEGSSYSGDSLDGTSPAIIAQVSELLNYVYGKTSVAGQIDRVSTIMRAYEGREAVLLELLETKALIKANADTSGDSSDLPVSLRNSPGLSKTGDGNRSNNSEIPSTAGDRRSNVSPETPVSVLSDPTMAKSPNSVEYPAARSSPTAAQSNQKLKQVVSPSNGTFESSGTKKKKGLFSGFFGSKKKGKGKFPSGGSESVSTSKSGFKSKTSSKKGTALSIDDKSI